MCICVTCNALTRSRACAKIPPFGTKPENAAPAAQAITQLPKRHIGADEVGGPEDHGGVEMKTQYENGIKMEMEMDKRKWHKTE